MVKALRAAAPTRHLRCAGAVLRTDRGSQFSDRDVIAGCGEFGIPRSMEATGSSYDDATAEPSWSIVKHECYYQHDSPPSTS